MAKHWKYQNIPEEALDVLSPAVRRVVELKAAGLGARQIGKEVGIKPDSVVKMLHLARTKLRSHGYDQSTGSEIVFGDPHFVKGRSAFYQIDPDSGERQLVREWVKTDTQKQSQGEMLKEFVEGLKSEIPKFTPAKLETKKHDDDLMAAVVIGDAHIGSYVFGEETRGDDFDTDMAYQQILNAVTDLVSRSPSAGTGLLVNVGDFLHADNSHGTTWSGTPLDIDTRRRRVLKVAAMTFRHSINEMLKKYPKVVVINARGNHDTDSSLAMSEILDTAYENEPRVEIMPTNGFYHYLEFGSWLIACHHGDKIRAPKLASIMARDLPEAWGRTTNRIWLVGHIHHKVMEEHDGCKVRSFGTLAPADSWHSSKGYSAERSMELLVFRRNGGMHSSMEYTIPRVIVEPDCRL